MEWLSVDVLVAYVVGSGAGILLFKTYIQEQIIIRTIDTLVKDDYCRSYVDDDGETHLYRWYELDDLLEDAKIRIRVDEDERDSDG